MVLYHFCAKRFLLGILRDGLTLGGTPIIEGGMMRLQMGAINGSHPKRTPESRVGTRTTL